MDYFIGDGVADRNASLTCKIPFIYCEYGYGDLDMTGIKNISEVIDKIKK